MTAECVNTDKVHCKTVSGSQMLHYHTQSQSQIKLNNAPYVVKKLFVGAEAVSYTHLTLPTNREV